MITRFSRRSSRVVAVATSLGLVASVVATAPAAAHAELAGSAPEAGAVLLESPAELRLSFTEPIDPATAVIEVLDERGTTVAAAGEVEVRAGGTEVAVPVAGLEPGVYTVSYQVVSAVDGHATSGLFAFVVDPAGTELAPVPTASSSSPSVDAATIAARWLALVALLVALGSVIVWWNAGYAHIPRLAPSASPGPPWLLIAVAACGGFAATALYLALAARPIVAAMGGGHGGHPHAGFPLDFAAPFGWTPFAIAMRVTLASALLAFGVALGRRFAPQVRTGDRRRDVRAAVAVTMLLGIALAGMSMAGHAAAIGGPAFAAIDWIHLVSVAAWLGGLPGALVLARRAARPGGATIGLRPILARHARLALVAAPVTALTGVANSPLVLGDARDLVATDYGNLLVAKATLLAIALGIGAVNHLAVRWSRGVDLRALVVVDVVVAALAVLAAAAMVTIQPASARQPVLVEPPLTTAHLFGEVGPASVHAAVNVPAPGRQTYQVFVADADTGAPRDDVQKVFITFTPPTDDLPPERVELAPSGASGLYERVGTYTPLEGTWRLDITVRRAGVEDESTSFEVTVSTPAPPEIAPPPDTGVDVPAPLAATWSVLPRGDARWLPFGVAIGALALTFAAAWVGVRARLLGVAQVLLAAVVVVTGIGAGSRALVTAANATAAADELGPNPVPATAESLAAGERLYLANCASCHGSDGGGDGPVVTVPDAGPLREAVRTATDAELSYRIAVGVAGTAMPPFAGTLTADDRWDLVNYLRERWGSAP